MSTAASSDSAKLRTWQRITVGSLTLGYAGYYFCRSNFSVATPLLLDAFGEQGLDKETIGIIVSAGVFFYAIGKLFNGVLCDFIGGRKMFLFGMVGSIGATVLFGAGTGVAVFAIAWSLNRLIQSMGWGALVKITSNWFPYHRYGTVMGLLSLSYLFGDALARLALGGLVNLGVGWRGVFYAAAITLGVIALIDYFLVKASPRDIGEAEPGVNPLNLYGAGGEQARPANLKALLKPFLTSFSFWLVMIMSLGLTMIREAFNFWTPTYLTEVAGLSAGDAGQYSLLFPFFGGISVLIAGWLADRAAGAHRGVVMVGALFPLVFVLGGMGLITTTATATVPLLLVSLAALLMIGPYSFLAGAISLDLGGKQGSSTAAGLADSAGYFGGILSGWGIGAIAQRSGWDAVFLALAVIAALTLVAAFLYWRFQEHGPVTVATSDVAPSSPLPPGAKG